VPFFQIAQNLSPDTTYFWSVQAIEPSPSLRSINTFTTRSEQPETPPVTQTPTIITYIAPEPTVRIVMLERDEPEIPVEPVQAPPAPQAALWTAIALGTVLAAALITLVLRTR